MHDSVLAERLRRVVPHGWRAHFALLVLLAGCKPVIIHETLVVTPTLGAQHAPTVGVAESAQPLAPSPSPLATIAIPLLTPAPSDALLPGLEWEPVTAELNGDGLPVMIVPEPYGIEIHFTRATRYELDLLQASGVRWVRMDLFWGDVERTPGQYDFSAYDSLVRALSERGMQAVFILDYGNPLYDSGHPPTSDAGRAAFARFAAAAARHYRDAGIIWEIWNEPNLAQFWYPEPNAGNYGRLALSAIAAIRRVDPTAIVVGPGVVSFPADYWQELARMGVLARFDAITVHPYGLQTPENVITHYLWLRRLLDAYSPHRIIPILVSEWGYASVQGGISADVQAQYLVREWLLDLAYDVRLSIWYDWRDDGVDPADVEQNFGMVTHTMVPKPAYRAAQAFTVTLDGYRFVRQLALESPDDYVLLFRKDTQVAAACWTAAEPHALALPLPVGWAETYDLAGKTSLVPLDGSTITLTLSRLPQVVLLEPVESVQRLAVWAPCRTIQHPRVASGVGVCVTIENLFSSVLQASARIWVGDRLLGQADLVGPPGETTYAWVPIEITGLSGDVRAVLEFAYPDQALPSLQRAPIWLLLDAP